LKTDGEKQKQAQTLPSGRGEESLNEEGNQMKKLLLASTALALSAGVAAAEVKLSGDARMGLVYDGADVRLTSRARVMFTMTGETDGGLAFGASFRANDAGPAAGNTAMTAGTVFISGDWGRLTMGDVSGAARAATGDLYGVGLTGLGDMNEMQYLDRINNAFGLAGLAAALPDRRTAALYNYSIDGFNLWVGVGQNQVRRGPGFNPAVRPVGAARAVTRGLHASIGASYTFEGFTVAAGYENFRATANNRAPAIFGTKRSFGANHATLSLEYAMDGYKGKIIAGSVGGDLGRALRRAPGLTNRQLGASVEGTFDATTVTAYVNRGFDQRTKAGLGMKYDLGGGAEIQAGVAQIGRNRNIGANRTVTMADFGLAFKF
jgi:outer membrane protein OmpU